MGVKEGLVILLTILKLSSAVINWEFGKDEPGSTVVFQKTSHIHFWNKVVEVPVTVAPCMKVVYVRVQVNNPISNPEVTYKKPTTTVVIQYSLLQSSTSWYEVIAKAIPTFCGRRRVVTTESNQQSGPQVYPAMSPTDYIYKSRYEASTYGDSRYPISEYEASTYHNYFRDHGFQDITNQKSSYLDTNYPDFGYKEYDNEKFKYVDTKYPNTDYRERDHRHSVIESKHPDFGYKEYDKEKSRHVNTKYPDFGHKEYGNEKSIYADTKYPDFGYQEYSSEKARYPSTNYPNVGYHEDIYKYSFKDTKIPDLKFYKQNNEKSGYHKHHVFDTRHSEVNDRGPGCLDATYKDVGNLQNMN